MISSEMPELFGMTDRILVMSQGRLAGIVNTSEGHGRGRHATGHQIRGLIWTRKGKTFHGNETDIYRIFAAFSLAERHFRGSRGIGASYCGGGSPVFILFYFAGCAYAEFHPGYHGSGGGLYPHHRRGGPFFGAHGGVCGGNLCLHASDPRIRPAILSGAAAPAGIAPHYSGGSGPACSSAMLNGVIVAKLSVPPFITTLGTMVIVYGINSIYFDMAPNNSQPIGGLRPDFYFPGIGTSFSTYR